MARFARRLALAAAAAALVGLVPPAAPASAGVVVDGWDVNMVDIKSVYTPLVGQFGGDAGTDILWYGRGTAPDGIWLGHEGDRREHRFATKSLTINGTYTPIVGDFGGDDYDDILWYTPGAAVDPLWISIEGPDANTAAFDTSRSLRINGTYSHTPVLHDYHLGAKDDVFFYAAGATVDYLYDFNVDGSGTPTTSARSVNASYAKVLAGDWSGDRREDLFFYAPGGTPDHRWTSGAGTAYTSKTYQVNASYTPVKVPRASRDAILWWADGRAAEAYWRGSPTSFESTPVPAVDLTGVPVSGGLESAIIGGAEAPNGGTIHQGFNFRADQPGYWYYLTSYCCPAPGRGTQPLVGDYDADGYVDILWYGKGGLQDSLWYSAPGSARTAPVGDAPKVTPVTIR